MTRSALPILSEPRTAERPGTALRLNPFLHFGPDRLYDPLTDRTLLAGDPVYAGLLSVIAGAGAETLPDADRRRLAAEGWLLPADDDPSHRFLLKYVSLEAHTVCNQACYFC